MRRDANAPTNSSNDPLIGLTMAHLFKIESRLGQGATSRVYRASQLGLNRWVAVKVLNPEYLQAQAVRARFHREARIAARIAHPAVVPVLMTGQLPIDGPSQGEFYIVYEYVDGSTLRQVLETREPLKLSAILGILIAAGEAVGAAHELGIIHRDLKPENLMIVRQSDGKNLLRVLDFGLAKLYESSELPLTHTGAVLGTPSYLSPEGARGLAATPRSDVYSLATIGYECLAGNPPFRDTSPIKLLMQQIDCEPPPLTRPAGVAEVPAALARVIDDNLSKSPSKRAETALSFARAMRQAAAIEHLPIEDYGPVSALWRNPTEDEDQAGKSGIEAQSPIDESETS